MEERGVEEEIRTEGEERKRVLDIVGKVRQREPVRTSVERIHVKQKRREKIRKKSREQKRVKRKVKYIAEEKKK